MKAPSSPQAFHAGPVRIAGVLLLAAAAAACHPARLGQGRDLKDKPLTVADRLDCPENQGDLRRTEASADGRSCRYAGPDGQEVVLSYLALDGRSPQAALEPVEAQFRTLVPAAAAPEPGTAAATALSAAPAASGKPGAQGWSSDDKDSDDDTKGQAAAASDSGAPTPPRPPTPPEIDSSWKAGHGKSEQVHIRLPFLSIDADGDGRAKVKTLGAEVDAADDHAVVHAGWNGQKADIHAGDGGAEMRFGSVGVHRADLTYILASDKPGPDGWRAAAYVARGPVSGPLVLAVGKTREGEHDRKDEVEELKKLVGRNVRVVR